jgi:hypothetical protein
VIAAMRSADLADMGGTLRRMPLSSLGLLVSSLALSLALVPKAIARGGWQSAWFLAVGLLLLGLALVRPYVLAAHGALRRRRAFEPARVREAAGGVAWTGLALAYGGAALVVASFLTGWLDYLLKAPQAAGVQTYVLWLAAGVLGPALAFVLLLRWRRAIGSVSARTQRGLARWAAVAAYGYDRWVRRSGLQAVDAVEVRGIATGEGAVGRWLRGAAALGGGGFQAGSVIAITLLLLVLGAVAAALLTPGVAR